MAHAGGVRVSVSLALLGGERGGARAAAIALVAVAVGLPPIACKAFGSLRNRVVDINTLICLSVSGACALGYFGEGAAVVALAGVSEWLGLARWASGRRHGRGPGAARARRRLAAPGRWRRSRWVRRSWFSRGTSCLWTSRLCRRERGERSRAHRRGVPVPKRIGDAVFGGTVNQGGVLEIQVTAVAGDSAVTKLVRLVEEAQAARSSSERAVETFAKHYTPLVVLVAFLIATTPYVFAGATGTGYVYTACVLLVVACPCALVLSTPVVSVCGLTKAAGRGMLVKGSAHLESLARCAATCVDKTGTSPRGAGDDRGRLACPSPGAKARSPAPRWARARCCAGRAPWNPARRTRWRRR